MMFERVILHVTEGTRKGQNLVLENGNTYILGRSGDCSPRFSDAFGMVSRHHCRLKVSAPLVVIQDLGSLNGTYVNDAKIGQRDKEQPFAEWLQQEQAEHPLWDGDEVRIGLHAFRVQFDPPPPCAENEERAQDRLWSGSCAACG